MIYTPRKHNTKKIMIHRGYIGANMCFQNTKKKKKK